MWTAPDILKNGSMSFKNSVRDIIWLTCLSAEMPSEREAVKVREEVNL